MKETKNTFETIASQLVEKMTLKEMMSQLLHDSPAIKRLNIPKYNWWNEGLHGSARSGTSTVFPQAIALSSSFDEDLLHQIASITATEQRAKFNAFSKKEDRGIYKGLTVWSPNVNIFRDPRWGRGQETYGEDPYLSSTLAISFIKGLQGDNPKYLKTAACVKHFVAHSGPEPQRHYFDAKVSKKDLEETYLPAFKASIVKADVNGVMGAYNTINGEACCATHLIQTKLRDEYGFKGMFISDCWAIRDFHEHHKLTKNAAESAALAVKLGCDLNCGCTYNYLEKAYQQKLISREEIKKACIRVMTTRAELGLFEEEIPFSDIPYSVVASEEHYKVSLRASEESIVLLKNDNFLPLNNNINSIAVIGPNADSRQVLWGNYHGTSQRYTTILEGIRQNVNESTRVYYSEGSSLTKNKVERLGEENDRISEAVSVAEISDVIVLCLGLNEIVEGEMHDDGNGGIAGDKNDLRLPKPQQILLKEVAKVGKPIILVLLSGGSLDPEIDQYPNVKALLQGWYPGEAGGLAIANIIFGQTNPCAKLPITFYKADTELPDYSNYSMKNRTYRYFETEPLYPFGFGLSYTEYEYSNARAEKNADGFQISFSVKNTGANDGKEISYVFAKNDHKDSPNHPFLVGFTKTFIKAGETKEVKIEIAEESLTLVDENGKRHNGIKDWILFIGGRQNDEKSKKLTNNKILKLMIQKGDK